MPRPAAGPAAGQRFAHAPGSRSAPQRSAEERAPAGERPAYRFLPQALVLGVPEVDAQHDEIFVRVDGLKAACLQANRLVDAPADGLLAFLGEHFATEERIAREARLEFSAHARKHASSLTLARRAVNEVRGGVRDIYSLLRYIEYWLERHIVEEDKSFATRLRLGFRVA